jgi:hypothetical protein
MPLPLAAARGLLFAGPAAAAGGGTLIAVSGPSVARRPLLSGPAAAARGGARRPIAPAELSCQSAKVFIDHAEGMDQRDGTGLM